MKEVEKAQVALQNLADRNANLDKYFSDVKITTTHEQKSYEETLIIARRAWKQVDDERKHLIEPLKDAERRINELFKPYLAKLASGINTIAVNLNTWHDRQKNLTNAEIMERAEEYWRKVDDAKDTGEVVPLPDLGVTPVAKTSHSNAGSVTYRESYEITIVDETLVPRDLCKPVISLIRKRAESGVTDIAGCVVTKKYIPVTRST